MQTTHDPPGATPDVPGDITRPHPPFGQPLTDDEVRMPRATEPDPRAVMARVVERADTLGSSAYRLMAIELREYFGDPVDPLDLIWDMAVGRYRWKRHRNRHLVQDGDNPALEYMSFRAISAELHRLTGESVAYETLRRWWDRVWEVDPPDTAGRVLEAHAEAHRAAQATQTNPDVPSAAFLPPADS